MNDIRSLNPLLYSLNPSVPLTYGNGLLQNQSQTRNGVSATVRRHTANESRGVPIT